MAEFSFVAPILAGKTAAWRSAIAEISGPRQAAYQASRKALGITCEHVSLQSTPMGDMVVVHMDAPSQGAAMGAMMQGGSEFNQWFLDTVLVGVHGFDPKGAPPPPVEVVLDFKG